VICPQCGKDVNPEACEERSTYSCLDGRYVLAPIFYYTCPHCGHSWAWSPVWGPPDWYPAEEVSQ